MTEAFGEAKLRLWATHAERLLAADAVQPSLCYLRKNRARIC